MKKKIFAIILILFIFINTTGFSTPALKINNLDTSEGGYIQSLINAAEPGDTVWIPSGIYYEHIKIENPIKLIGENKYTTIIDCKEKYHNTISIYADNVEISGFTIRNCTRTDWGAGVYIETNNNKIYDNIINDNENGIFSGAYYEKNYYNQINNNEIHNNGIGILFYNCGKSTVLHCNIHSNSNRGIRVTYSSDISMISNDIHNNSGDGISFWSSHNNYVENNKIYDNRESGIFSWASSSRGTFKNNVIKNNKNDGIFIFGSLVDNNYQISKNLIESNGISGIIIDHSKKILVTKNDIIDNKHGIYLSESEFNDIINNNLTRNKKYGVIVCGEYDFDIWNNFYYNNFRENNVNAKDECNNKWYKPGDKGNYWDNYDEPDEGAIDNNNDGLADTPYSIAGGDNQDKYPLMEPLSGKKNKQKQIEINSSFFFFKYFIKFFSELSHNSFLKIK